MADSKILTIFVAVMQELFMIRNTLKTKVVGVDISSDRTTVAVVDVRGNIIAKDAFPTATSPNIADYASVLCDHIVTLVEAHGGYESIRSVGVSISSGNFRTGVLSNSPNLPWKGVVPIAAMLQDRIGLAVALGNNAHARALGEHAYGSAHGLKDFILITLGNGMGSCFYSNGVPHLGKDGFAGEIGHTCAVRNGRQCGCGAKGCLEMYTSTRGIILTAREMLEESDEATMLRGIETLTVPAIVFCCEKGDAMAIEVMRRTGEMLGVGLATYASIVNPEAIIFTGSVTHAGDWLFTPAKETFDQHVFHNIRGKTKFLVSALAEDEMDVLGASALAWEIEEYSLFK